MLDPLDPTEIADVHQSVDTVFDFNECAEIGQIANPAFNGGADRILVMQRVPGIGCQLPHTERDAPLLRIHVQHHGLDLVAHIDQFRGMLHAFGPGHFADVNQALDALLQLYKGAVVGDTDDASADPGADGIAMLRVQPRVGRKLFEAE